MAGLLDQYFGQGNASPINTAAQNFAGNIRGGGGLLSSFLNAAQGYNTGVRTDPVGRYQQMTALTSQLLQRNGMPQDQADLAALDPNAQKAVIGRLFPTYEFKEAGGQGVSFNPYTGAGEPVISMPKGPTQLGPGEVPVFTQPSFPSARAGAGPTPLSQRPPIQSQPLPPPPGVPGQASPTPGVPALGATAAPPGALGGINLPPGVTMGGTPMTVQEQHAQEASGKLIGDARAKLGAAQGVAQNQIDVLDQLLAHPGRNQWSTGPLAAFAKYQKGTPQYDFYRLSQQTSGQARLNAIAFFRGTGSLSDAEGKAGAEASSAIDAASSPQGYEKAVNAFRNLIITGYQNQKKLAAGDLSAGDLRTGSTQPSFTRDQAIAEARRRGIMK